MLFIIIGTFKRRLVKIVSSFLSVNYDRGHDSKNQQKAPPPRGHQKKPKAK